MIRLKYFFLSLAILFVAISCKRDARSTKSTASSNNISTVVSNTDTIKITNRVNFYFENSGSMNGYLEGEYFRQTMGRIIHKMEDFSLQTYFVNTKEYSTSNILSKIRKNQIRTTGIENSDHKFIFKNAIENSIDNNLSIVVTDGIYSMNGGNLSDVEIDIQDAFEDALKNNAIETVVLKMSSNYEGTYYTESECDNVGINQKRPYYILLFGNKETIDNALKNIIIIDQLDGFKEQARFSLTNNLKIDHTIVTQGEEKKGSFRKVKNGGIGFVKEIEDAERYNNGSNGYLQFGIAVEYNNLSIPNQYLLNVKNYLVDNNTGYSITEIRPISDLESKSLTKNFIDQMIVKKIINPTHIIVVKAEKNILGELKIELKNNFPEWISKTGTDNDCEIIDDSYQTFAFDKLMIGISKAYNTINNKEEYFEIKLKIKH
jgi:hypothetical protein